MVWCGWSQVTQSNNLYRTTTFTILAPTLETTVHCVKGRGDSIEHLPGTFTEEEARLCLSLYNSDDILDPDVWLVELQTILREDFTITEKALTIRAFFWLKAPSYLRHY